MKSVKQSKIITQQLKVKENPKVGHKISYYRTSKNFTLII